MEDSSRQERNAVVRSDQTTAESACSHDSAEAAHAAEDLIEEQRTGSGDQIKGGIRGCAPAHASLRVKATRAAARRSAADQTEACFGHGLHFGELKTVFRQCVTVAVVE
ncbi:hypothetical protein GUF72_20150 [Xanthomonas citri pv. citri]|uniref:Uncharacterized protein n=2 Tax=Xanthomonas citri TaxID=346 RepID=A0A7U2LTL5_XANCI|nr:MULTISPECIES: hypothetical protein [Xanthomonas]KAB0541243.1 hypothetical protein F7R02_01535 [Xanthomonas cissicola]MBD1470197.1 hypothetical protein [Xanthomonas citri pv. citri]MBD1478001.1 hypothetical protein [Xanthomonas citri pv. citri]MBD1487303.1 hypothetical protein [Xanthomonas citri pv. citri]MBD1496048.1 hypothetical protein [Xanthomonas citri pv. citri]